MGRPAIKLEELTSEDKLNLIGELWNSLSDNDVTLSEAQRRELHRRLDLLETTGPTGSPWGDVEARIRASVK